MGNMLESGSSSNVMQMDQKGDQPNDNQQKTNTQTKENFLGNMMEGPSNQELEVKMSFNLPVLQQQSVLFLLLYLQPMY